MVQLLQNKSEYLENQSRRNNLIFFGLPLDAAWDRCEVLVKEVIREGLGIDEEIHVDQAHRYGKAIVVRFLSFKQRSLILSQAQRLKQTEKCQNVFIREDFSVTVQQKRKELINMQKELRSRGTVAKLRFDKLITDNTVYQFDTNSKQVVTIQRSGVGIGRPDPSQDRPLQHSPDLAAEHSQRLPVNDYPPLPSGQRANHFTTPRNQPHSSDAISKKG
ncbi:hypothetical protein ACOMHN_022215 [Nucella lapillus]